MIKGLGPGGAERLLVDHARTTSGAFQITCAYVLPWKSHLVADLQDANVRCVSLGRRPGIFATDVLWPLRLMRIVRSGFDVIHIHSPLPGAVARLAARTMPARRRPTIITTMHNRWVTFRRPTRVLARIGARRDQHIVCVTDEVRRSLPRRLGSAAIVVQHGVRRDSLRDSLPMRAAARAEIGLDPDQFVVVTVANFRAQKDYPTLLRSFRDVVTSGTDAVLLVVGQGPDRDAVHALTTDLELSDSVHLLGYRADVPRVLAAADCFVLASKWEGFPVAVMEAMAMGLPIVATNVGGMAEHLADVALLVPPGDPAALAAALRVVVTDEDRRQLLAAASDACGQRFDVRHGVEIIESMYAGTFRG